MKSEDAINVKNGHILMDHCLISGAASDAFDLDFCKGEIRNSNFRDIGGDGVDFSGSYVTVSGCRFENVGDKGISVGENSHPILINNLFNHCNLGFSSKDLSDTKVAFCTFVNNNLAIEAKRKKPFFGGATGTVVSCVFSGNKKLLSEDYFSKDGIVVRNSLADTAMDWPACKTLTLRFVAPAQNNYLLEPGTLAGEVFETTRPEWANLNANAQALRLPGIFTNSASLGEGH